MIKNTSGNNSFGVSPAGLEHQQSQSPVADATGNDVAPSGLIANSKTAFGHIDRSNVAGNIDVSKHKSVFADKKD